MAPPPTVFSCCGIAGEAKLLRDTTVTRSRKLVPFLRIIKGHQGWLPLGIKNKDMTNFDLTMFEQALNRGDDWSGE